MNKAIAGFLAAATANEVGSLSFTLLSYGKSTIPYQMFYFIFFFNKIDNGQEFDGKWPMTTLYSIYYEFSKRYPHSRITAMKQETTCSKTELVLRMLNYTIGSDTFKKGLQQLIIAK